MVMRVTAHRNALMLGAAEAIGSLPLVTVGDGRKDEDVLSTLHTTTLETRGFTSASVMQLAQVRADSVNEENVVICTLLADRSSAGFVTTRRHRAEGAPLAARQLNCGLLQVPRIGLMNSCA